MKTLSRIRYLFLTASLCGLSSLITGCGLEPDPFQARIDYARQEEGPLHIALAWPLEMAGDKAGKGARMAIDEINANGGVLGRQLVLDVYDDQADVTTARIIAQDIIESPDTVAVVGHYNSYVSIPNAAAYEYGGVLVMNPASLSSQLTQEKFNLIFRNIPSDAVIGASLANYLIGEGYQKVLVYYVRNAYGRSVANAFERSMSERNQRLVSRIPYEPDSDYEIELDIRTIQQIEFDSVLLIGTIPTAAEIVKQMRAAGIDEPIFNGSGLDSPQFMKIAGDAAEGVVVASPFFAEDERPEVQAFVASYASQYNEQPDPWAAQVYDAVHVIAHAMEEGGSAVPADIAASLRKLDNWPGVTGPHSFDSTGEVSKKPLVLKVVKDGQFEFLARATQ